MKASVMTLAHQIKSAFKTFSQALKAAWTIIKARITRAAAQKVSNNPKYNIGKVVELYRDGAYVIGQVRGLMFDKRVDLKYYRVVANNGKVYHLRTNRKELFV